MWRRQSRLMMSLRRAKLTETGEKLMRASLRETGPVDFAFHDLAAHQREHPVPAKIGRELRCQRC
jgi:hypothetical protein